MGAREQQLVQNSGISLLAQALATTPLTLAAQSGHFTLGTGGALTITIATPVAGPASQGGDDGKVISFSTLTAQAHVVQTAANKINTNKVTATSSAAIGNFIMLVANNGIWWVVSNLNFTLA